MSQQFPSPPENLPAVAVPERLALSLKAMGPAGQQWLAGLPAVLAALAAEWSITFGAALSGGRAGYVAEAVGHDGTPMVLKVALPPVSPFERQLAALRLAAGEPYAHLIRYDVPRQALLLERLGPPLASTGWPAARRLDALTRTAARGWRPAGGHLPDGAEAARWHAGFVPAAWEALGRPCPEMVIDRAVRYAAVRAAAFDPNRSVLVHGDVHETNTLRGGDTGFRLVDPIGLASEPAHDLGVIQARGVEGHIGDLAAGEPRRALERVALGCRRAGRLTGVDPEAIRQWAFIELVSTGLSVLRLGDHDAARPFLTLAGRLAGAPGRKRAPASGAAAAGRPATLLSRHAPASGAAAAGRHATLSSKHAPASGMAAAGRPVTVLSRHAAASSAAEAGRPATLFLMVGLPGAGKTTRARELAAAYRALRLTPDEWMIPLFGEPDAGGKRDVLEGQLITLALQVLRLGTSVVLDFGLWSRDERSSLRLLATSAGASSKVIYIPVGEEVQRARVARRQALAPHTTFPMTEADLGAWRVRFQEPDASELAGGAVPGPPPPWRGWLPWAKDRWPSLTYAP
jgi:predicted kinase/streptomycin 6-kinase